MAAGYTLPLAGTVLVTVANRDKEIVLPAVQRLAAMGFTVLGHRGHRGVPDRAGHQLPGGEKAARRPAQPAGRHAQPGDQHGVQYTSGKDSIYDDSYIRKAAIKYKIPYMTTPAAAVAAAEGIAAAREATGGVKSLQAYHQDVREIAPDPA